MRDIVCRREFVSLSVTHAAFGRGAFHLLVGEPESGHELLLRVLGLLEVPDAGEVFVDGEPVHGLSEEARLKLRERRLGFVFTAPFLLPAFSVIENVAMPLFKVSDVEAAEARRRSDALLDFTGLLEFSEVPCAELTPFTQHRVSLARALVNEPSALLVEGLDSALAGEELRAFSGLLRLAASRFGIAVIATASPRFVVECGDRVLNVAEGVAASKEKLWPETDA
ncbi:MAG: ATP-binding cassette domain-containing protein [Chthoniobacteraceae bacterium]